MMITDANDYFSKGCGRCKRFGTQDCSAWKWRGGLDDIRQICLDLGLVETVKWGHPCYMHAGRNIAVLGAFRADYRINFFNPSLMKDPEGILEKSGPNTRQPGIIRFADNAKVARMKPYIRSYLKEAMSYAEAGINPLKEEIAFELPDELVDALDGDPEMSEAFKKLTPGRKKSYVININSTKKATTRNSRIAKFRDKILAGKGAVER